MLYLSVCKKIKGFRLIYSLTGRSKNQLTRLAFYQNSNFLQVRNGRW